ncbi:MAG TPA: hypothetical protein VHB70_02485 [Parafilimonas sp.]|nr:hypothetical protein [Parafilimonas sp.]
MKKSIQQKSKSSASADKKNTRPFTTKQKGYKEDIYNNEEQKNYEKSELSKNKKNTAGPKS